MSDDLIGQVAIVTGGGRGVGRGIALALAKAGASVMVAARSRDQIAETADLIRDAGGRAAFVVADVTDRAAVARIKAETEQQLGSVDLLVNNAGVFGPIGPTWEVDPDAWWRGFESHLRGTLLCSHAVLPGMVARGRGRIINVASRSGGSTHPYTSSYTCAKAAVLRFTDTLAAETRPHGIAVFAIYPGLVPTAMTDELTESDAGRHWLPGTRAERAGKWITPEPAGRLCVYLAAGRADVLSGRFFGVDDDVPALVARAAEIARDDLLTLRLRTDETGSRK